MRILRINGTIADIDDKTAIGIDLQNYDIKEPAKRRISVSNSFTIPITNKNLDLIGYIGRTQSRDTKIYDAYSVDYYVNNTQFIYSAKMRVQAVEDRIECFVYERPDIWDNLKLETWNDFSNNFLDFLSVPKLGTEFGGTWADFLTPYVSQFDTSGVHLPYMVTNTDEAGTEQEETISIINEFFSDDRASGGHFCVYLTKVFEYIETAYGVDFGTNDNFDGNIFKDAVFQEMYFNFRNLGTDKNGAGFFFFSDAGNTTNNTFCNSFEAEETEDKNLYDFVLAVIQIFNIMPTTQDGETFKLRRFDDIETAGGVEDFSGNIDGTPKFRPYIQEYAQNNQINFQSIEPGLNEFSNGRVLTSENKNLEEIKELFKINGYIPQFSNFGGKITEFVPYYPTKDSFKNFKFFVNGGFNASESINYYLKDNLGGTITIEETAIITGYYYPALYDLNSEYTTLDSALDYPVLFELKKWMNAIDVLNFDFYKLYYIRELNGSFYVNKIKGFNPDKSKQATTLELFKISNALPHPTVQNEPWEDGVGNDWTDGVGTEWITKTVA